MHEPSLQGKSHDIPKRLVWCAWLRVEENGGAAGPDGVTIEQFQGKVQDNLYKLWNRMSSGSYFPGPVCPFRGYPLVTGADLAIASRGSPRLPASSQVRPHP